MEHVSSTDSSSLGEDVDLSSDGYLDIMAVCDIIKSYFRSLPESLIPEHSYWDVIQVMSWLSLYPTLPLLNQPIEISDFEERLSQVRRLVHELPNANYYLLRRVMEHLER